MKTVSRASERRAMAAVQRRRRRGCRGGRRPSGGASARRSRGPGSGPPNWCSRLSNVFRPITSGCPSVIALNRLRSAGRCHGSVQAVADEAVGGVAGRVGDGGDDDDLRHGYGVRRCGRRALRQSPAGRLAELERSRSRRRRGSGWRPAGRSPRARSRRRSARPGPWRGRRRARRCWRRGAGVGVRSELLAQAVDVVDVDVGVDERVGKAARTQARRPATTCVRSA